MVVFHHRNVHYQSSESSYTLKPLTLSQHLTKKLQHGRSSSHSTHTVLLAKYYYLSLLIQIYWSKGHYVYGCLLLRFSLEKHFCSTAFTETIVRTEHFKCNWSLHNTTDLEIKNYCFSKLHTSYRIIVIVIILQFRHTAAILNDNPKSAPPPAEMLQMTMLAHAEDIDSI